MALNQEQLKADLKSCLIEVRDLNTDADKALDVYVDRLAKVFIKHIKTIKINYTSGLSAPNGSVTGTFIHTIE